MNRIAAAALALLLSAGASMSDSDGNILVLEIGGETKGMIEIELLSDIAPNHVNRIRQLAGEGHYDNVVFHRVIDGFMAQTGDVKFGKIDSPNIGSAGMGGSDLPNLKAEFSNVPYETGVVGMARAQDPDSANSQFFIMFADAPFLNGQYTVIGRVLSGQKVVNSIKKGSSQGQRASRESGFHRAGAHRVKGWFGR